MLIVHPDMHIPAYISAYSSNGATIPTGGRVPLTTAIEPSDNITFDWSNNALIPAIAGTYSVIMSVRANPCTASVNLMQDGMMNLGAAFNINSTNLNHSLTTIIEAEANKPVYLQVMAGPLVLPNDSNASITMNLIKKAAS